MTKQIDNLNPKALEQEYLKDLLVKMNNEQCFRIKFKDNSEYIASFAGEGICYYELNEDEDEVEVYGFTFRIIKILNDPKGEYSTYDLIETHLYNQLIEIEAVDILDYIEEGEARRRIEAGRILGFGTKQFKDYRKSINIRASLAPNTSLDPLTEMPMLSNKLKGLPKQLVPYTKLGTYDGCKEETLIHFYKFDELFDSKYGVWNTIKYDLDNKRGFSLNKLNGYMGIITPDYSLYGDMPRAMQLYNIYRNRVVGAYLVEHGYYVIPNVRWCSRDTYLYSFGGLDECEVIAISTFAGIKGVAERKLLADGLEFLLSTHKFKLIIIYGGLNEELKGILDKHEQKYIAFETELKQAYAK